MRNSQEVGAKKKGKITKILSKVLTKILKKKNLNMGKKIWKNYLKEIRGKIGRKSVVNF